MHALLRHLSQNLLNRNSHFPQGFSNRRHLIQSDSESTTKGSKWSRRTSTDVLNLQRRLRSLLFLMKTIFFAFLVLLLVRGFGHCLADSILKCVNWYSYLLRAWLDVAASSRATANIQWLSSSSMSTPVMCQWWTLCVESLIQVLCAAGHYHDFFYIPSC